MSDNIDPWLTDNDRLGDTVNVYLVDCAGPKNDTVKAILLISACIECPAYTIRGYVNIRTGIITTENGFRYEQEYKIFLDEYKQRLGGNVMVWDYRGVKSEE
ncbi:MAG: hypothetical protein IPN67_19950 [Bacteroidales bacterium]|nr:hypothetical protein [Bacteroidales bacterium]